MSNAPAITESSNPTPVNVATPLLAVAVTDCRTVAPSCTVAVTTVELSPVSTLPAASRTSMTGCPVNAAP